MRLHVLNPFDKRSVPWDMAADIATPAQAIELATILVPESKGESQPFFPDTVRTLINGVLTVFMLNAPGKWTFRHVLLTMQNPESLKAVLLSCNRTKPLAERFLTRHSDTLASINATIATKMGPFEPVAAAWDVAARQSPDAKFSIQKWLKDESIVVLGNDETSRSTLDLVNRVILKFVSEQALAGSETKTNEHLTWFFLDEFREAGKLPGLKDLVLRGRSKGCSVVLGFQDIEGLQEVYGNHGANEIVGQCGQKALLRLESESTAKWASEQIGKSEFVETSYSQAHSRQGNSQTYSQKVEQRESIMASEFLSMPTPGFANGLTGVYLRSRGSNARDEYRRLLRRWKMLVDQAQREKWQGQHDACSAQAGRVSRCLH